MNDLNQYFGADLSVSATGDLMPVDGDGRGQQRVLRRLLTNPGDYLFHPSYGAGVRRRVGDTLDLPKLRALIRGQILLEEAVAKTPEPQITLTPTPKGVTCAIRYADAVSKAPVILNFNVSR